MNKPELEQKISDLEVQMAGAGFWTNKDEAQLIVKEYQELKEQLAGADKYDKGGAIITIFSGAGGDDAEDFSAILFTMYRKWVEKNNFGLLIVHQNQNDHGGFRNITFEINGSGAYGILKNESGVHRLVRISPFNAKKLRHTSFSLVEVLPQFAEINQVAIPPQDLDIDFTRSSGPGGQNVNKRETAVRIVHVPTGLSVHYDNERTQEANRRKALAILEAKLYKLMKERKAESVDALKLSKNTDIEWGSQIRSYVFHPYKMVKDHRTEVETSDVAAVLDGDLALFLEAEKEL